MKVIKDNSLLVRQHSIANSGHSQWWCECHCGEWFIARYTHIKSGEIKSCGCRRRLVATKEGRRKLFKHGHSLQGSSPSSTYQSWRSMVARCTQAKRHDWHHYGGRGIKVCERWLQFENFLADMGERPAGMTLDRVNVNGNYEPSNCRWATNRQQSENKRKNVA